MEKYILAETGVKKTTSKATEKRAKALKLLFRTCTNCAGEGYVQLSKGAFLICPVCRGTKQVRR